MDKSTRVIIQGITGSVGRAFAERVSQHKGLLVGGVTPGRQGEIVSGVHVYDNVEDSVRETGANFSLAVVPKEFVKEAVIEAVDAGIKTVVIYTEGVQVHDALIFLEYARIKGTRIIGPNAAGVLSTTIGNISDINDKIVKKGKIGVISKSGTLTYELLYLLYERNLGVSTVVCLGGDILIGTKPAEILELFDLDPETEAVVMLGEPGGTDELSAADYLRNMKKPVYAYISGLSVPVGVRMGHAGALAGAEKETSRYKLKYLEESGAKVSRNILDLVDIIFKDFHSK